MLVVLDTSVLIDYLRGRPVVRRVDALRRTTDTPATTALNVEELYRGLRNGEHVGVDALLRGLRVLVVGEQEARTAGEWRRGFAARGVTLAQADCLIAATALTAGGSLATGNPKDFPMRELAVEHWPVGA